MKKLKFYTWVGVGWLVLWIFNTILSNPEIFVLQSVNEIWRVIYLIFANFIFFEYSLPFIRKKRPSIYFNVILGILLVAIHLILVSLGLYGWRGLGILLHIYTSFRQVTLIPEGAYYRIIEGAFYEAQGGISSIFFFGIAKLLYDNFQLKQAAQKLRLEKQEAELNYLKSQTNPHFLFNTLNNIYSLARDKSDLAPESILRLSKILRFMLYETSGEFISAEKELEIINDYIALEKLRYDDNLQISFSHEIEELKLQLPPLLLIPLVENAFKHGVSETRNQQPFIDIILSASEQQLTFTVKNSTEIYQEVKPVKENIGLSNLRRQLELLYTDYDLSVEQGATMFTAKLKINLASHV